LGNDRTHGKWFADEVAHFYGLKRLTLPQLVAATSLAARFSPRFLRDTAVFPFEFPKGHYRLAVADPSDTAAVHAAEIVLGAAVAVEVPPSRILRPFSGAAWRRGDGTARVERRVPRR